MVPRLFDKLKTISPWHFIWISIAASELITFVLSTAQGRLWWGEVSRETLIVGAVDALVVPLIVASLVVYFVRHTAELERVNARLRDANRKLQEIDRMKSDFLSTVSHELRTPLTTMKAFVELIVMKPGMPREQKERLMNTVRDETERLTRLSGDLLDLARIESGSMKWRIGPVTIDDVIQNSVALMKPLLDVKRLSLTSTFCHAPVAFSGDRDRLVQVVTNILSNAVKFTQEGGTIAVSVRTETSPASRVIVAVSDTGIGIPAGDLERIFEKFYRSGDRRAASIEGTGLGLAIARQIVEYHGGGINAACNQGPGSTITFWLPVADGTGPTAKGQPLTG